MLLLQICCAQREREREAPEAPEKQIITITCPVLSAKFDKLCPQILISLSCWLRGATDAEIITLRGRIQEEEATGPPPPPHTHTIYLHSNYYKCS